MTDFTLHTPLSAPIESRESMIKVREKFGFVPNLFSVLSQSPAVMKAYMSLSRFLEQSSFSPKEQQLLLLAVSVANDCGYCVAAHTTEGRKAGLEGKVIEAVRDGKEIPDPRLAAIHRFTINIMDKKGMVSDADIDGFLEAGFTKAHVLELVLAISIKTLSNYVNHIAGTPHDRKFETDFPAMAAT